nr:MAG TPA: hypothetical protein [Caudoviricetes sp.]
MLCATIWIYKKSSAKRLTCQALIQLKARR